MSSVVAWHDLECGRYRADLALWHELASRIGPPPAPILDVGAGTGRVALSLARAGHRVIALDSDADVLAALRARADALPIRTVLVDARDFALGEEVALVLAPMQTVQLLGGAAGRARFLAAAAEHLRPGGLLAAALATALDPFGPGDPLPAPDVAGEMSSQPVAVREEAHAWTIARVRRVGAQELPDEISLDRVSPEELEAEATEHGLTPLRRRRVPATTEHVGSTVVVLRRG